MTSQQTCAELRVGIAISDGEMPNFHLVEKYVLLKSAEGLNEPGLLISLWMTVLRVVFIKFIPLPLPSKLRRELSNTAPPMFVEK